jgi:hypothetical protein
MIEREPVIRKMPDQKTLEAFVKGMSGKVTVVFNSKTGEFETVKKVDPETTGEPKTEYGEKLRRIR